jgi:hypothetical protein
MCRHVHGVSGCPPISSKVQGTMAHSVHPHTSEDSYMVVQGLEQTNETFCYPHVNDQQHGGLSGDSVGRGTEHALDTQIAKQNPVSARQT